MTMLDSMRRHKNWLKWSLALVVLAFIALYFPSYMNTGTTIGASPSDVVATVNGTDIRGVDFQRRYQNQIQAYQQQYGGNVNEQLLRQLGIDQQILQQMVDEQAALAEARRLASERRRRGVREPDEHEQVLCWLADVDEDTFYKWQRRASDTIATILWEEHVKSAG
jgi:hypothetical protein